MALEHTILSINSGSSSLKFAIYRVGESEERLVSGAAERIGAPGGRIWAHDRHDKTILDQLGTYKSHREAVELLLEASERETIPKIDAAGHRVVHGGLKHESPERVTPELIADLIQLTSFAPLHLPSQIDVMRFVNEIRPGLPQVACFDTAFHRNMPEIAQMFPLPRPLWHQGVRRYGFHGLSYEYIVNRLGAAAQGRTIAAHLGNGASLAAIRGGKSVDTTMGLTPTGGLMMGTRCGDIDPGVLVFLMEARGYTAARIRHLVDEESGLQGVSGISRDMKTVMEASATEPHARQAIELFCYTLRKHIGAMAAAMGGIDQLVFTGGIGEHMPAIREKVCAGLAFLGIELDSAQNNANADTISNANSRCTVRVIPTNEELVVVRHTIQQLNR
jgi:acetate kinase